jgi:hypothetical protein
MVPWCLYLHTIVVQMNVVPSGICKLLPRMTQTCGGLQFLSDFFSFSYDVKQRGTEFEGRPWNTSTGIPPIDSNDVNLPIRSFYSHDIILWNFPRFFKGTVNLVYVNFWPSGMVIQWNNKWNNLSVNNCWKKTTYSEFGFHVKPFPQRDLPGTKNTSAMGTAEESLWNLFV